MLAGESTCAIENVKLFSLRNQWVSNKMIVVR